MREVTPAYRCEVCGKSTSRLLGFFAVVSTTGPSDETVQSVDSASQKTSARSWLAGICMLHRDEIRRRFEDEVAASGKIEFMGAPPAELRPADVPGFRTWVDEMAET